MKKLLALAILLVCALASAQTPVNPDKDGVFISMQVINPTTSTALTVPSGSEWATISVRNAGVHVSYDASTATTSKFYLAPGFYRTLYVPHGNPAPTIPLTSYRFIDSSDGASTLYVAFFKRP